MEKDGRRDGEKRNRRRRRSWAKLTGLDTVTFEEFACLGRMGYYFYRTAFSIMVGEQMRVGLIEARGRTPPPPPPSDEQDQGNGGKIVS